MKTLGLGKSGAQAFRPWGQVASSARKRRRMPGWELTINDDGQTLVVKPRGELDLLTAPELAEAFAQCSDGHRAIICDLSEVEFMDSTGLRLMITTRQAEPDRFGIACPSEPVERLFELTGTTNFFRRIEGE